MIVGEKQMEFPFFRNSSPSFGDKVKSSLEELGAPENRRNDDFRFFFGCFEVFSAKAEHFSIAVRKNRYLDLQPIIAENIIT